MARTKPKYASLNLPKLVATDLTYQEKVEFAKSDYRDSHDTQPVALAADYAAVRREKELLEEKIADANLRLETVTQLLIESQEIGAAGWGLYGAPPTTLRLAHGGNLRVQVEPYSQIEDRDTVREHFIKEGMGRLLAPAWQTVNSANKERLLSGEPQIPGTKVFMKSKIVFTAAPEPDEPVTDVF